MQMIRDNWQHYRDLYSINTATYRNDFALSIALGIVSGHTGRVTEIPWPLLSVLPDTQLSKLTDNMYQANYRDSSNNSRWVTWQGADFHAMGKQDLEKIIAAN
jgi:hypothetical protein